MRFCFCGCIYCEEMTNEARESNLRGDVPAQLRVGGKTFQVRGEIIEEPGAVRDELRQYFRQRPGNAKYFNIKQTPEGAFDPVDLQRAAEKMLIIRLHRP